MKATRTTGGLAAVTDGQVAVPVASMSVAHRLELQDQPSPELAKRIERLHELEAAALADLDKVETREQLQAWHRKWIG